MNQIYCNLQIVLFYLASEITSDYFDQTSNFIDYFLNNFPNLCLQTMFLNYVQYM
jgi:hypothetical protein